MQNGEPSFTALTAAAARAAHLIVDDEPHIFRDTVAERLLGERAEEFLAYHRDHGDHPVLAGARVAATTRSRITEDRLRASGLRRYVILGAGLDSYAQRCQDPGTKVFELDHPATQEWKRARLAAAGMTTDNVTYIPLDFENGPLDLGIVTERTFVSWLGVTMYLTREAIETTLSVLAGLPAGSEIVLDHVVPDEWRDAGGRLYAELVAPVAAGRGEPWLSAGSPPEMAELLAGFGFETVRQLRQRDVVDWPRTDALRPAELTILTHARRA